MAIHPWWSLITGVDCNISYVGGVIRITSKVNNTRQGFGMKKVTHF